jgi:SAM-dependent methyltransferase
MNVHGIYSRMFGTENVVVSDTLFCVGEKQYPILDGVIILLDQSQYTPLVQSKLAKQQESNLPESNASPFAKEIQTSFGSEWQRYNAILSEHKREFDMYFDCVDLESLKGETICDLGCGIGRWSYFLTDICDTVVLVDFSDAIFEAKRNLHDKRNCLFFMGDIKRLPFDSMCFDFVFSLGVLHHLPTNCLNEVRQLSRFSPQLLIYLYYALDNRPFYYRWIFGAVTLIRKGVSRITNSLFRIAFAKFVCIAVYCPAILLGGFLSLFKLGKLVPLYEGYRGNTLKRIEQDVYDRFFTQIEQRVSKKEIMTLKDTFSEIIISDQLPYWHFVCKK